MERLSPNFSLAEMTHSATAARRGLSNKPTDYALGALRITAERMEAVRAMLGDKPISVLSGYRSPEVNKAVRGSKNSAHMSGLAVDFICPGFGTPREIVEHLAANLTGFDQVIEEFGEWVHIGFGPGSRHQVLTARKDAGKTVYEVLGR